MKHMVGLLYSMIVAILLCSTVARADDTENNLKNYSSYRTATTTVYYIPFYNLDNNYQCGGERKIWIYKTDRKPLAHVCLSHFENCRMQGSCVLIKDGERLMAGYSSGVYFSLLDQEKCPYGYGPRNICLEPFYSIAADPNYHRQGDVLYIHELRGLELPNGETHNGFVVVRDVGGKIRGRDRFDLFTGFVDINDPSNPFTQNGFQDKRAGLRYAKVISEDIKQKVLSRRKYPGIASEF